MAAECATPRVLDDWRAMATEAIGAWADCRQRHDGLRAWARDITTNRD